MNYLIHGARIVNEGRVFESDVLIRDGMIGKISPEALTPGSGTVTIDAGGRYLIPGIIDEHVHFREPGLTHKADIRSESRAAVSGGVTSFMDMPNTVPQTTTQELLEQKFELAAGKSLCNYSFYLGATNDNLDEIKKTDPRKVCGIKLFLGSSTGGMLVDDRGALERILAESPCLVAAHCEDEATIRREAARLASGAGPSTHPLIRSREACFKSTRLAVDAARKTGARLHVLHISTKDELKLLDSGIPLQDKKITAETCPHYLTFSDRDYLTRGYAIKCNPAIKSESDREALLGALRTGLVDTIGTDHAPHLRDEKFTPDYSSARSGFPSIQHSLEMMIAHSGLELPDIVRLMCHNPATLYRLDRRGFIREGYHADLALVELGPTRTITDEGEYSKCAWTPYSGMQTHSRVTHTFVGGNLVWEDGIFHEEFRGERLEFRTSL